MSLFDKANAVKAAADKAKAQIDALNAQVAALTAENTALKANQADPALEQQIAVVLDAAAAELGG